MADDSREPTKPSEVTGATEQTSGLPPQPKTKYELPKSQVGKLWDAFGNPEDQVNMLPTAHGKNAHDNSLTEAWKTFDLNKNASTFYKTSCGRSSLLYGIGAAFGIGGVRGVLGGIRSIPSACNYAAGAFVVTALASFEFCRYSRIQELDNMKQAVQMMQELKLKKQREKEERAAAEAARLAEEERKRKSWKFW
ncbi:hypothetical protein BDW74DRAFT_115371 [Aspergillus multicolor]|uniref:uncharacterized protein n=1 Tax=Aspergillus multicolor TaxID=41759 RepID=UPI003CCDD5A2